MYKTGFGVSPIDGCLDYINLLRQTIDAYKEYTAKVDAILARTSEHDARDCNRKDHEYSNTLLERYE